MNRLRVFVSRLLGLLSKRKLDLDLDEEVRFHLEMETEANVRRGMNAEDARQAARREFGNVSRTKEAYRDHSGLPSIETFLRDLRYAFRSMRKAPGFAAAAILTLGVGIGANSAIFTVINAVLIRPLPYANADRLVTLAETAGGSGEHALSLPDFQDWKEQSDVFERMAAHQGFGFTLTGRGEPERIPGRNVSPEFFATFGVQPMLGRDFLPEDNRTDSMPVVILSHSLWQRRFGGDPAVLGMPLNLNGRSFTVVGILPQVFQFYFRGEVFAPIGLGLWPSTLRAQRRNIYAIGLLKPGVSLQQARTQLNGIASRIARQYADTNSGVRARVVRLSESFAGGTAAALQVLLGAVGFVLLIACGNVSNLLLARAAARRKEIAIRAALGAGRARVIRQMLTESVLLGVLGGGAGLILAYWSMSWLLGLLPENIPRVQEIRIDGSVLSFTGLISAITGIVFGFAPALHLTRSDLQDALKNTGRSSGFSLRGFLIVSEMALSLVLLIGAGLMAATMLSLKNVDPGFLADDLISVSISLPQSRYSTDAMKNSFTTAILTRLQAIPGVQATGSAMCPPLNRGCWSNPFLIEGQPVLPPTAVPNTDFNAVTPDYFRALGVPLRQGRYFDERDGPSAPPVAIINESMARRWPNQSAIGKRLREYMPGADTAWRTIVGVVGDVKRDGLDSPSKTEVYQPFRQNPAAFMTIFVRSGLDSIALANSIRNEIRSVDKDLPIGSVKTMREQISESMGSRRLPMILLGSFALLALVLAAVGVYGVSAYSVAQRTREMGIRIALGAQPSDVLKLTLAGALRPILLGLGIGLALSLALTRVRSSFLYGVSARDPRMIGLGACLLAGVALLATHIPARRASRVDPLVALRHE